MSEDKPKTEAPKENPAMGQIVGYLKDYPFLLITVASLLIRQRRPRLGGHRRGADRARLRRAQRGIRYVYDSNLVQSAWGRGQ
jgi:hypothetical protein